MRSFFGLVQIDDVRALALEFVERSREPVAEFLTLHRVTQRTRKGDTGDVAFRQMVVRAGGDGGNRQLVVALIAHNHDRYTFRRFLNAAQSIQSRRARQADIENDGVELTVSQRVNRITDARDSGHFERRSQHRAHVRGAFWMVFDDEHSQRRHACISREVSAAASRRRIRHAASTSERSVRRLPIAKRKT